jgi:hypothetical protein
MELKLTPTKGYAIGLLGLLLLLVLYFSTRFICKWIVSLIYRAILRYIVYSNLSLFGLLDREVSVKETLFPIVYASANGFCMGWDVKSAQELSRRCATLLVTNLIILLPGASVAADILRIPLRSYQSAHSVVGLVALIEGSIHATHELAIQEWDGNIMKITGLAVSNLCMLQYLLPILPGFCVFDLDERCVSAKLSKPASRSLSHDTLWMLYVHLRSTLATHLHCA